MSNTVYSMAPGTRFARTARPARRRIASSIAAASDGLLIRALHFAWDAGFGQGDPLAAHWYALARSSAMRPCGRLARCCGS
jgi:hypothetical protein